MSKAANMSALEKLHAAVADYLSEELKNAIENGMELSPQMLSQAIKFLKDNGVEPARDVDNSKLDELAQKVANFKSGDDDPDISDAIIN